MRGSKLQEALHLLIRKLHFKTDGRIDGSQEAQGNRVTRKMDSCVSLKPHTPGKHHHTEKKKKVLFSRRQNLLHLLVSSC